MSSSRCNWEGKEPRKEEEKWRDSKVAWWVRYWDSVCERRSRLDCGGVVMVVVEGESVSRDE